MFKDCYCYNNFRKKEMEKSKLTNISNYDNALYMDNFFQKLEQTDDKTTFQSDVQAFDQQLYQYYAARNYATSSISKELYELPFKEAVQLNIPKQHSLADSMLRSTLGCDDKFAQKYLQITDLTQKEEEDEKKKRVEEAKKKFGSYNSKTDFMANTKPFMNKVQLAGQRPVIENQYDMYIKTHLTFLDKPKPSSNNKDYSSKQTETIAKKIAELGGIEDTIGPIENSLSTYELRNIKIKGLANSNSKPSSRKVSPSPSRGSLRPQNKEKETWIDKSKALRQSMSFKMFI